MPIHTVRVALLHHHGRAHDANFALVEFVVITALVLPIYWSPLFVVGVIGLAHPTNVEDRLRWWVVVWISVLWKFSWETCFMTKFASSGLPFSVPFG